MTKQIVAAVAAGLTLFSASASMAQQKPTMHKPAMHKPAAKMTAAKSVYVCTQCKEYFSPMSAKKMNYKDSMGHKLTKMAKTPAGFSDGSKSTM